MMQEVFAGLNARAAMPSVQRVLADYRPDIVLREPTEYAGLLAAEQLRVPHGRIAMMAAAMEAWGVPVVAGVLDRHRKRLGLPRDPSGRRITREPVPDRDPGGDGGSGRPRAAAGDAVPRTRPASLVAAGLVGR